MILHPAVIALLLSSIITCFMVLISSYHGLIIIRKWDIQSGSELQLKLERRTYLVTTVLSYVFIFELISLFLYIFTAENLHTMFVGAMCGAGTLNVGEYGYQTLLVKIAIFFMAGIWLIVNYTNNRAFDYPLIKLQYILLLSLAPLTLLEMILQSSYLLNLKADVITSCCGSLFSRSVAAVAGDLQGIPLIRMELLLWPALLIHIILGVLLTIKGRGVYLFAIVSVVVFLVGMASIISYVSPYIFELPVHNCPFCILKAEYCYIGYAIYVFLFGTLLAGVGSGVVAFWGRQESLKDIMPTICHRLALVSLVSSLIFSMLILYSIVFSNLKI